MKKTFTYREKFSWGYLFLLAMCVAGIFYALTQPFNIRFKRLELLAYPTSNYVVIAASVLMILYVIHKLLKMKATNSQDNTITVSESELEFKHLKGYSLTNAQVVFGDVNELWNKTDDDDGESMVLYTEKNKNRYEFFAENFASAGEFAEFKKLLEQKCVYITNKA